MPNSNHHEIRSSFNRETGVARIDYEPYSSSERSDHGALPDIIAELSPGKRVFGIRIQNAPVYFKDIAHFDGDRIILNPHFVFSRALRKARLYYLDQVVNQYRIPQLFVQMGLINKI